MADLIPYAATEKHIAFLGSTGSGKSSAAKRGLIEPVLTAGGRVVVLDPTGAHWGLRLDAGGKKPGFPIYIFGGDHGDYPLKEKGYLDTAGERVTATGDGIRALGPDYEPLPTGAALREHWLRALPEGERKVLELLIELYPDATMRETIDSVTGYKRSSRDAYLQRLSARELIEFAGSMPRAAATLFD